MKKSGFQEDMNKSWAMLYNPTNISHLKALEEIYTMASNVDGFAQHCNNPLFK
jgi:hypothetical protein